MGGLARRAALFEAIEKEHPNVLKLDGGDVFGLRTEQEKKQTEFLCDELAKLGYKVFGVGEWDFNYGLDFLRQMEKEHGFLFVNANVHRPGDKTLLFPPYTVVEQAGVKIGIISVLSPSYQIVSMTAHSDNFVVESPKDALVKYLPELRKKSDMIVLLSHLSSNETRELLLGLGDDSGVDIAIEGHDYKQYRRVNRVGNTLLLAANNQGKYIGQLDLVLSSKGAIEDQTLTIHGLDAKSPTDDAVLKRREDFEKQNTAKSETATAFVHPRPNGDAKDRYLGVATCQRCHAEIARNYFQTAHARAFQTLVAKGQANNADCVSCHVVGFYNVNGYDRVEDPNVPGRTALKNVQCEACHGYGSNHSRDGAWVTQAKASCVTCHDEQNSPDFDYDTYWAKIAH